MKRYIKASETGSWLLSRSGKLIPTQLHVPSTTYLGRGVEHLCPTDAEFLLNQKKIDADTAKYILDYCLVEYLRDVEGVDDPEYKISVSDITKFNQYADMRYAPKLRSTMLSYAGVPIMQIDDNDEAMFASLNNKYYKWLANNFVKVSMFGKVVEFRINSTDGFDWNQVIIDDCILEHEMFARPGMRFNILRETKEGYKQYFMNTTFDDLLKSDNVVLSSQLLSRKIVAGQLIYEPMM